MNETKERKLTEKKAFLTFHLNEELFAIDVFQTKEAIDQFRITKVPKMPDYMLGVINLRGSVVPIVDMKKKLGLPQGVSKNQAIIVIETEIDGEPVVIGCLTDQPKDVVELSPEMVEDPPKIGSKLNSEFIIGLAKKDDQFIIVLDINKIFKVEEAIALIESASSA
jgi:purine-binding chemotaxis protein CheW